MTDELKGLREDVAFMRTLAEEGRDAPLLGGSILVAAGLTFTPAALAHWAALRGWWGETPAAVNWPWLIAAAVFLVCLYVIVRRLRSGSGVFSAANRAFGAASSGIGLATFALFPAFMLASMRTGEWIIMSMYPPVILAGWGALWFVAAEVSGRVWFRIVGGAAFLLAVVTAAFAGSAEQYLLYAVAIIVAALLPGLALMRQARQGA